MSTISIEKAKNHHVSMVSYFTEFVQGGDALKLSVSNSNIKMGAVASISLPAVITCRPGAACASKCYALRMEMRRANVAKAYARNLALWVTDPASYERQAISAAYMQRFFRWHVSGDIISRDYLAMMIRVAETCTRTEFLVFTKKYELINAYINEGNTLPENLHVIFSAWPGEALPNPHRLPVAAMVPKGSDPEPDWQQCGGNCTNCACRGCGCWALKAGQTICFAEH